MGLGMHVSSSLTNCDAEIRYVRSYQYNNIHIDTVWKSILTIRSTYLNNMLYGRGRYTYTINTMCMLYRKYNQSRNFDICSFLYIRKTPRFCKSSKIIDDDTMLLVELPVVQRVAVQPSNLLVVCLVKSSEYNLRSRALTYLLLRI